MGYGDSVIVYEEEPQEMELTPEQKAKLKHEQDLEAVRSFAGRQASRDEFVEPSAQVRQVVYDPVMETSPLVGQFTEMLRYYTEKSSRLPSFDAASQKKAIRDFQDIADCRGDQYAEIRSQKMFVAVLSQDMGISRTDRKATSDSGIAALSTVSTKQDMRVTNNSPQMPSGSIFDGISQMLGKKKRQE